jgi:hypothetical protein
VGGIGSCCWHRFGLRGIWAWDRRSRVYGNIVWGRLSSLRSNIGSVKISWIVKRESDHEVHDNVRKTVITEVECWSWEDFIDCQAEDSSSSPG